MTASEKKLILALSLHSISEKDFYFHYPSSLTNINAYILVNLQNAYIKKSADDLEYLLLLGFYFYFFSDEYVDILNNVIQEPWHYMHEDIALILQDLKSFQSVDALYKAALMELEYLNYDKTYALARKCIHALGDINTEYAKEKLRLLATSEIAIIKEKAEKQLYYYKREG